jgi:ADP-heptose:LPS heptosyltransferase
MNEHPATVAGRVLAIRLRQLGDVIVTLGALRALKEAQPGRKVFFMVDAKYHALLENLDYIDALLPEPPKIDGLGGIAAFESYVRRLRRMDVDCVLDFHSNSRSALLSFLSGAPIRVGFDVRMRKLLYTDVEPRAVRRNGRIQPRTSHQSAVALARRIGLPAADYPLRGTLAAGEKEKRLGRAALSAAGLREASIDNGDVIALNPGNPYPAKAWPEDHFIDIGRRIVRRGRPIVILWGPGERARAERIVTGAGTGAFLSPELRLEELPGVLSHLAVLVTIDSGLKHLAVALGTPTVTLFGPTSPLEWHMGGMQDRYLSAGLSCSPCRLLECPFGAPCMSSLSATEVDAELTSIEEGAYR